VTAEPVVRPARQEDRVTDVVRAAFSLQGQAEGDKVADLWTELAASEVLRGSLVAEVEGEVVGHVGLSRAWIDARRELVEVWVLSPLSVVPERQGTGIGTCLVAAAVKAARAGGAPLLFLEGDPGYYSARGFERADRLGFAAATPRTPAAGFLVARLDGHEHWMTGGLVYPDLWWRHDAAGLRDPRLAEIEERMG
jgi:putative acetyltransferase